MLLDEATSALDEESQSMVQDAINKLMGDRTTIIIAHRLTTVKKCERIAVILDGKIVEDGSYKELTRKKIGVFAKLAKGMR